MSVDQAQQIFNDALNSKMEFFLSPAIRERLKQGEKEPMISELLQCQSVPELKVYLVEACLRDPEIVETINRYLKRIIIKPVKISSFRPSVRTIEKDQIDDLVEEFKKYLESQFEDEGPDSLSMLQLE